MSAVPSSNRQIARAAGTVMLAFIFSQIVGLVRNILVARTFGASAELDAFLAANRVAETLFNLIAGGALGSAFIPTFTAFLAQDERQRAWKLAAAIANWVLIVMSVLAVLAAVFAPQIVRHLLAPGFSSDPAQFALTVTLLRIQLISAVLFGLSGLVMGILNSHQVFLLPALAPAMYQLGMIFGVLVLAPRWGIHGLAVGVVLGAAAHLLIQVPALLRRRGSYTLTLGMHDAAVSEVLRLMAPRLLGVAVVQINFWVNTWLASQMGEGSITAISLSFTLMLMAQAVLAQSIATAAMPTFAAHYALGRMEEIRTSLAATLRGVLLLALPAALGLILLRQPIICLLYDFDSASTDLVAWALLWYAAGLVGHSLLEVLARTFYAMHDTKTPVLVGAAAMSLNILFSFLFSALFSRLGWMPHGGLALANSLATALEAAALLLLIRRRLGGLAGGSLLRGLGAAALGTLALSAVLFAWERFVAPASPLWNTLGGILAGGAAYLLVLLPLRLPELRFLLDLLARRLRPKGQEPPGNT